MNKRGVYPVQRSAVLESDRDGSLSLSSEMKS